MNGPMRELLGETEGDQRGGAKEVRRKVPRVVAEGEKERGR